jgi:hypothetical protein
VVCSKRYSETRPRDVTGPELGELNARRHTATRMSGTTSERLLRFFAKVLLFLIIVQVVLALSDQGYLP